MSTLRLRGAKLDKISELTMWWHTLCSWHLLDRDSGIMVSKLWLTTQWIPSQSGLHTWTLCQKLIKDNIILCLDLYWDANITLLFIPCISKQTQKRLSNCLKHLFYLLLLFWGRNIYSPGQPRTHQVARAHLELLSLCLYLLALGLQPCPSMPGSGRAECRPQALMQAKRVLYQLSCIPRRCLHVLSIITPDVFLCLAIKHLLCIL